MTKAERVKNLTEMMAQAKAKADECAALVEKGDISLRGMVSFHDAVVRACRSELAKIPY
jgi:hypothetical protein